MEEIELRSEGSRRFIEEIPPILIRMGTLIVSVIIIGLGFVIYKLPYPISIEADGIVKNGRISVYVPYKYYSVFDDRKSATVAFEGSSQEYYFILYRTSSVTSLPNGDNYFLASAPLNEKNMFVGQKIHARILVENKTLWQQFFK